MLTIRLGNHERERLSELLREIDYCPAGGEAYIAALRKVAYTALPDRLLLLLERQRRGVGLEPFFTVENVPVDHDVTGSPAADESGRDHKSGCISENALLCLTAVIGEPYSIWFEGAELVNNLVPHEDTKRDYTGNGSEVELDFHIENAALRHLGEGHGSPCGVTFMGVRQPHGQHLPVTRFADARRALAMLGTTDRAVLATRSFRLKIPYRWRRFVSDEQLYTQPISIVAGPWEHPEVSLALYEGMTEALTPEAERSLVRLAAAIKQVSEATVVRPGMFCYVDNRFALHSRDAFEATYDEHGRPHRWLQRVFVASTLWDYRGYSRSMERVFRPLDAERGTSRAGGGGAVDASPDVATSEA